jgi:hypothetical protein
MVLQSGADITATDDIGRTAGDDAESLQSSGAATVDPESLRQIYDLFKEELEAARRIAEKELQPTATAEHSEHAEAGTATASVPASIPSARSTKLNTSRTQPAPAASSQPPEDNLKLAVPDSMQAMVAQAAAADADSPITGVTDVNRLLTLLVYKVRCTIVTPSARLLNCFIV